MVEVEVEVEVGEKLVERLRFIVTVMTLAWGDEKWGAWRVDVYREDR